MADPPPLGVPVGLVGVALRGAQWQVAMAMERRGQRRRDPPGVSSHSPGLWPGAAMDLCRWPLPVSAWWAQSSLWALAWPRRTVHCRWHDCGTPTLGHRRGDVGGGGDVGGSCAHGAFSVQQQRQQQRQQQQPREYPHVRQLCAWNVAVNVGVYGLWRVLPERVCMAFLATSAWQGVGRMAVTSFTSVFSHRRQAAQPARTPAFAVAAAHSVSLHPHVFQAQRASLGLVGGGLCAHVTASSLQPCAAPCRAARR